MTDRRIRKTRSNIFAALSALLARRESPDSISVTELCEKADISKSTFICISWTSTTAVSSGRTSIRTRLSKAPAAFCTRIYSKS